MNMKNILAIVLLLLSSVLAYSQGGSIYRQVISPPPPTGTGQPAYNATVRVCTGTATGTPCSPLAANIYSDQALTTPISNPLSTDSSGNYYLFAPTGVYLIQETPVTGTVYSFLVFVNGTGTVSSVALSMPGSVFSVTGTPITTSGTFNVTLLPQSANTLLGNCTGSAATPSFCSLTANMLPSTLNATTIGGNLGVSGDSAVTGNETVGGTLGITGNTAMSTFSAASNGTVGGTLGVTGNVTLGSALGVTGASTLSSFSASGNGSVGGTLGVTGAATLSTSLVLNGSQAATGYQGTAGTKLVTGSGSWTNGHHLCANGTSDAIDCGATYASSIATVNAGAGAGTGPTITCIADAGNHCYNGGGVVQVATGSSPSALATIFSVVFGGSGWNDAYCTFAPADSNSSNLPGSTAYIHGVLVSTPPISYSLTVTPAVTGHLVASTTYTWSYQCSFL